MMKIIFTIFLAIIFTINPSLSVDVNCQFKDIDFNYVGSVYTCIVQQSLGITSPNIEINNVRGSHQAGKTSNDVKAFMADDKNIQYIPKNLAKVFKNLAAIKINRGFLKELSPDVFAELPNLRYIDFDKNSIEVLEADLFKFNTKVERIWIEKNRIKGIDGNLFTGMNNLKDVDLSENSCIQSRFNGRDKMSSLIMQVRSRCDTAEVKIASYKRKLDNLQASYNALKADNEKKENVRKELEERQKPLENDIKNLEGELKVKDDDLKSKMAEVEAKIKEINEIKAKNDRIETKIVECEGKLNLQLVLVNKLTLESKHQSELLNKSTSDYKTLENNYHTIYDENLNLKSELDEAKVELSRLNDEISTKVEEISEIDEKFSNLTEKYNEKVEESSEILDKFLEISRNLTKIQEESDKKSSKLTETIKNLKVENSNLSLNNDNLQAIAINLQNELDTVMKNFNETLAEVTQLSDMRTESLVKDGENRKLRKVAYALMIALCFLLAANVIVIVMWWRKRGETQESCEMAEHYFDNLRNTEGDCDESDESVEKGDSSIL